MTMQESPPAFFWNQPKFGLIDGQSVNLTFQLSNRSGQIAEVTSYPAAIVQQHVSGSVFGSGKVSAELNYTNNQSLAISGSIIGLNNGGGLVGTSMTLTTTGQAYANGNYVLNTSGAAAITVSSIVTVCGRATSSRPLDENDLRVRRLPAGSGGIRKSVRYMRRSRHRRAVRPRSPRRGCR